MESVKDVFEGEAPREIQELNITPELIEKIVATFTALEDLLTEAFPDNKLIKRALVFLASYVKWFL